MSKAEEYNQFKGILLTVINSYQMNEPMDIQIALIEAGFNDIHQSEFKKRVNAISDEEDILFDVEFCESCEEWEDNVEDLAGINYASFGYNYCKNKLLKQ